MPKKSLKALGAEKEKMGADKAVQIGNPMEGIHFVKD
jgi:hypothetical protein